MELFPSNQIRELVKGGYFLDAAEILRGSRSRRLADANLYDTLDAELRFELGDDETAVLVAQHCLDRDPSRELACRLHRLFCLSFFNRGYTDTALEHLSKLDVIVIPEVDT
jgi:hypothetical protein